MPQVRDRPVHDCPQKQVIRVGVFFHGRARYLHNAISVLKNIQNLKIGAQMPILIIMEY